MKKPHRQPPSPFRFASRAMVVLALTAGVAAAWIWFHGQHKQVTGSGAAAGTGAVVESQASVFAGYAGSQSCRECHREAYEAWAASNHGLAERPASFNACQAAFQSTNRVEIGSQLTGLAVRDGRYEVTTPGLSSNHETHTVERVIGRDPLVQFLVSAPGGRWQALETAWDPHRQQWFDVFGAEDRKPGEWGHWTGRGMNWNSMCATCHNTRLRKNYDEATDAYHTAMAEMSVGCEACHGPAKAHVQWQQQYGKSGRKDPAIPQINRTKMVDTCGACHARRTELTGDFKPGDDFLNQFDLAMVDRSDLYYPDGQVRSEDYEYASFLGSRMHAGGVVCADCHEPHSAKRRLPGNWLCLRCHNGSFPNAPVIDPVAHSHHRVHGYNAAGKLVDTDLKHYQPEAITETGGECVNCHMPQTLFMQRHWRHDHGFTIPDPLLTKQLGIPNACNRCHQDKDTDWSLGQVEKWYGARMDRPDRPRRARARTIAQARAGDPASVEPLLGLLANEPAPYWRAAAINLLEPWAAEPRVRTNLLQSLNDTNALVRAKAARLLDGLAETQNGPVLAVLQARLNDPVRAVRIAAGWSLRSSLDSNSPVARELDVFLNQMADQPQGQLHRGGFLYSRGELTQALEYYRKALEWDPNSAPIRHDLAVVYSSLNQNREALEQLEAAVRLEPQEAEYHYKVALALNESGDLDKTIAELETAVRLNPRHARAWYNLGLARAARQDLNNALDALTRAEGVDARDPRIPYARATVLAQLGRAAEARAAANRALELQPNFQEARQLLEELH